LHGLQASICFATYRVTQLVNDVQLFIQQLKDVGIDAEIDEK
jgi:hypothetical protein